MVSIEDVREEWIRAQSLKASGDTAGALFLFRKIANLGFHYALFEVGYILEAGSPDLEKDIPEAIKWYEKAVDAINDEYALFALGRLYFTGQGIDIDYTKAYQYFYMLKDSKQAGAIYVLGLMREKGWGTSVSQAQARHYYESAARAGHLLALTRLGIISLKTFKIRFGLKCLWRSQIQYSRIRATNPTDWRIGIKLLDKNMQEEVVYQFSL